MNLLINWANSLEEEAFKELIVGLNVKKCYYFSDEKDKIPENQLSDYIKVPIYRNSIYDGLQYCKKNQSHCIPLDSNIIDMLKPFEMEAFEIINRWRRSILKDDYYTSIKNAYFDYLQFWYDFIIQNKIECLIQRSIPHQPTHYICYAICKALNIKVVTRMHMVEAIEGIRCDILASQIDSPGFEFQKQYERNLKKYKKFTCQEIKLPKFLEIYSEFYGTREELSLKNKRAMYIEKPNSISRLSIYIKRAKKYLNSKHFAALFRKSKHIILAQAKDKGLRKYIVELENNPNRSDKYILYALHYQPEATTVPGAGLYANQLLVIDLLSKSLPPGYVLYVKEHPVYWDLKDVRESMWEWRSRDFYQRVTQMRNVRLINHNENNDSLIKNSIAVATGTGTIGLEALAEGKNVLVFGGAYYKDAVGVYHIRTKEDCLVAIREITEGDAQKPDEKSMRIYLKTLEKYAFITGGRDHIGLVDTSYLIGDIEPLTLYVRKIIALIKEMGEFKKNDEEQKKRKFCQI